MKTTATSAAFAAATAAAMWVVSPEAPGGQGMLGYLQQMSSHTRPHGVQQLHCFFLRKNVVTFAKPSIKTTNKYTHTHTHTNATHARAWVIKLCNVLLLKTRQSTYPAGTLSQMLHPSEYTTSIPAATAAWNGE
jgi:hypothetical protein